jgi:hypothetical protein
MQIEKFIFAGKEKLLEVRSRAVNSTVLTALSIVGAIVFFIRGFLGWEVRSHERSFSFLLALLAGQILMSLVFFGNSNIGGAYAAYYSLSSLIICSKVLMRQQRCLKV